MSPLYPGDIGAGAEFGRREIRKLLPDRAFLGNCRTFQVGAPAAYTLAQLAPAYRSARGAVGGLEPLAATLAWRLVGED